MEPIWDESAIAPRSLFLRWHLSTDNRLASLIPAAVQYRSRAILVGLIALTLTTLALFLPDDVENPRRRLHFVIILVTCAFVMAILCLRYCLTRIRFRRYGRSLSIDYDAGVIRVSGGDSTIVLPLSSIDGLHVVTRHIESQLFIVYNDHEAMATLWLHTDINSAMWPLIESFREIVNLPLVSESTFNPKLR